MNQLTGKKILTMRDMTDAELSKLGWTRFPRRIYQVIVLDDGSKIFPLSDDEGNDIGRFCVAPPIWDFSVEKSKWGIK